MKRILITVFSVLFIDQLIKIWVKTTMPYDSVKALIPGVIDLHFVENPGMAFGWMIPGHGEVAKLVLSIFRICAVIAISFYLRNLLRKKAHRGLIICVSMILAGAMGNIIDSAVYGLIFDMGLQFNPDVAGQWVMYHGTAAFSSDGYSTFLMGHVVDMFRFTLHWPDWMPGLGGKEVFPPIFNIADASISFGVGIIVFRQKKFFASMSKKKTEEVETTDQGVTESAD